MRATDNWRIRDSRNTTYTAASVDWGRQSLSLADRGVKSLASIEAWVGVRADWRVRDSGITTYAAACVKRGGQDLALTDRCWQKLALLEAWVRVRAANERRVRDSRITTYASACVQRGGKRLALADRCREELARIQLSVWVGAKRCTRPRVRDAASVHRGGQDLARLIPLGDGDRVARGARVADGVARDERQSLGDNVGWLWDDNERAVVALTNSGASEKGDLAEGASGVSRVALDGERDARSTESGRRLNGSRSRRVNGSRGRGLAAQHVVGRGKRLIGERLGGVRLGGVRLGGDDVASWGADDAVEDGGRQGRSGDEVLDESHGGCRAIKRDCC